MIDSVRWIRSITPQLAYMDAWNIHFGKQYETSKIQINRHERFLQDMASDLLDDFINNKPNMTLVEFRDMFPKEWKKIRHGTNTQNKRKRVNKSPTPSTSKYPKIDSTRTNLNIDDLDSEIEIVPSRKA